ncbi:MAG: ABC transporter ATP-binding protein [Synergistaceae bacterium]|jgi:oligopeptide/dipeptide ABC transporter ATP-binding protein|nr:ABC transporter ATP-binding protein [Synergistaceae bacterium]
MLDIRGLSIRFKTDYGVLDVLDGVSMRVFPGEMTALVGESGCGKSVTIQSVMRLHDEKRQVVYDGEIFFKGRDVLKLTRSEMRAIRGGEIAMIFQDSFSSLDPIFRIEDQLLECVPEDAKRTQSGARDYAASMLERVGINEPYLRLRQYPFEMSGGMRQRVAIAMALSRGPSLLLADEPTTALDVTIQAQVMELIRELNRDLGMGVILVTHDLAVVSETCERALVMYLGQIVEEASVGDMLDRPAHPYTLGLVRSIPQLEGPKPERLYAIEGMVPLPGQITRGCRFAPRCRYALPRCCEETPELRPVQGSQSARCWRIGEF